jgi:hypothetical protein
MMSQAQMPPGTPEAVAAGPKIKNWVAFWHGVEVHQI